MKHSFLLLFSLDESLPMFYVQLARRGNLYVSLYWRLKPVADKIYCMWWTDLTFKNGRNSMVSEKGEHLSDLVNIVIKVILKWFCNHVVGFYFGQKIGAYDQQIWEKSLEQTELKVMYSTIARPVLCCQYVCNHIMLFTSVYTGHWKQA